MNLLADAAFIILSDEIIDAFSDVWRYGYHDDAFQKINGPQSASNGFSI